MGVEFDVAQFVSAQIKDSKSAATVAYIDLLGGCIKTNVVGVVTVRNCLQEPKRVGIVDPASAILCVGNEEPVLAWHVEHALWLVQPGNRLEPLRAFDVEDFYCVVLQSGDKQPLVVQVHCKVIDPAFHSGQGNCLLKLQRLGVHDTHSRNHERNQMLHV